MLLLLQGIGFDEWNTKTGLVGCLWATIMKQYTATEKTDSSEGSFAAFKFSAAE